MSDKKLTVDQAIALVERSGKAFRRAVQVAAVAVLEHAVECGDYSKANKLVQAVADGGGRADSLVAWFIKFGGLKSTDEAKKERKFDGWSGKECITARIEDGRDTWWDTVKKPQNPFAGIKLRQRIAQLVKAAEAAEKHLKDHPEDSDKVDVKASDVEALRAILKAA